MEPSSKQSIPLKPAGSWKPGAGQGIPLTPVVAKEPSSAGRTGGRTSRFRVEGMTCGNCARHVQEAALKVSGVDVAQAEADAGTLQVWWKSGVDPEEVQVARQVTQAGYPARALAVSEAGKNAVEDGGVGASSKQGGLRGWSASMWVSMAAALPLMVGEWILGWHHHTGFRWLAMVLATVAMIVSGSRFARGAWRQARAGTWGMDALVTLGAGTAYFYSLFGLLWGVPGHLYFMEAAAILAFISAGHWLEARVAARAETALKSLLHLAPSRAVRVTPAGEQEVDVADLVPGDLIWVRAGDRVPTDGVVEKGEGGCDESMLTGESLPVHKGPGDAVMGGTMNVDGRWLVRVKAVGADTALAQIVAVVRRAQTSRASIQQLTDQITQVFVPAIVAIALVTGLLWIFWPVGMEQGHRILSGWLWSMPLAGSPVANAVMAGAAVLIVACPCAMGLATPAAIMAAANSAARRGMLIRDGRALEKAGAVTLVAFDKTGTLTAGRPEVVTFELNYESSHEAVADGPTLRAWAADLARSSRHPLSRALAAASPGPGGEGWVEWKELSGRGIEGRKSQSDPWVRLGSVAWMKELGIALPASWEKGGAWGGVAEDGSSRVVLAVGGACVGWFWLRDRPKAGASDLIRGLRDSGLKVRLLTGDRRDVAVRVGREMGFEEDEILSEVRPENKAGAIEVWQKGGERVAFVGDGINDGPALSQAELGIAVTDASDVARETADILLLRADMDAVPAALELSRKTLRVIRQNLFWAFAYNVAAVPLAALGLLHPILCAVAMGCSDIIVLGNALRLLRIRPRGSKSS